MIVMSLYFIFLGPIFKDIVLVSKGCEMNFSRVTHIVIGTTTLHLSKLGESALELRIDYLVAFIVHL